MTNENDASCAICFNCASLYIPSNAGQYTCPYCKHSFDVDLYEEILEYAKTAVYYGYDYRKKYEEQTDKDDKVTTTYCLNEPLAIACFIGVAAISGIIGNASYDLVKKVVGKIKRSSENIPQDIGQWKQEIFIETNINVLVQYIQEFHADKLETTDEIKYHIGKERLISSLTALMLSKMLTEKNLTQKDIHNTATRAFDEYHNLKKPCAETFDSFWKDVDAE